MRFRIPCLTGTCLWLALGASAGAVQADDWLFRRSYYSHSPFPGEDISPRSRAAYRQPYVGAHPRYAIRGGYRYNNIVIQNGNGTDRTIIRENWADINY